MMNARHSNSLEQIRHDACGRAADCDARADVASVVWRAFQASDVDWRTASRDFIKDVVVAALRAHDRARRVSF